MKKQRTSPLISFFTALALAVTQVVPAGAALTAEAVPSVESGSPLQLPPDLGTIQALHLGTGPTLIHIQDAHGNYEAQKKIEGILRYLRDHHGVRLLLLEGSAAKLNPELLRFFPDRMDLTRKIVEDLTREAIVKGDELFLLEDPKAEAHGIENIEAYRANREAFKAVLTEQEKTEGFIRDMDMQIERLTGPFLNKDLRAFLKRLEDFEAKRLPFMDWLSYLKGEAKKDLEIDLTNPAYQLDWPMLERIFKLAEFESKIDSKAFGKEREEFLHVIARSAAKGGTTKQSTGSEIASTSSGTLSRNDAEQIERLLSSPISRHQLPDPETGLLFERMVASLPADFNYDAYPNVKLFMGHLILQSEVKGERLMAEMNWLTDQISEKLAKSGDEKKILALLKDHRLLKRLFALELTPEDYSVIAGPGASSLRGVSRHGRGGTGRRSNLQPSIVIQRFLELNKTGRVRNVEFTHADEIDSLFEKALEFYRGVQERDAWMLQNIEARLQETGAEKAVVITGGFHTEPFRNYFQSKGYTYALIAPRITEVSGREAYLEMVLQNPASVSTSTMNTPRVSDPVRQDLGENLPWVAERIGLAVVRVVGEAGIRNIEGPSVAVRALGNKEVAVEMGPDLAGQTAEFAIATQPVKTVKVEETVGYAPVAIRSRILSAEPVREGPPEPRAEVREEASVKRQALSDISNKMTAPTAYRLPLTAESVRAEVRATPAVVGPPVGERAEVRAVAAVRPGITEEVKEPARPLALITETPAEVGPPAGAGTVPQPVNVTLGEFRPIEGIQTPTPVLLYRADVVEGGPELGRAIAPFVAPVVIPTIQGGPQPLAVVARIPGREPFFFFGFFFGPVIVAVPQVPEPPVAPERLLAQVAARLGLPETSQIFVLPFLVQTQIAPEARPAPTPVVLSFTEVPTLELSPAVVNVLPILSQLGIEAPPLPARAEARTELVTAIIEALKIAATTEPITRRVVDALEEALFALGPVAVQAVLQAAELEEAGTQFRQSATQVLARFANVAESEVLVPLVAGLLAREETLEEVQDLALGILDGIGPEAATIPLPKDSPPLRELITGAVVRLKLGPRGEELITNIFGGSEVTEQQARAEVRTNLVLARGVNEQVVIGPNRQIIVTVAEIRGDKVRLGTLADERIPVNREEVFEAIKSERGAAPSPVDLSGMPPQSFNGENLGLILARKKNESIFVNGDQIKLQVLEIRGQRVRLLFQAPSEILINRAELLEGPSRAEVREAGLPSLRATEGLPAGRQGAGLATTGGGVIRPTGIPTPTSEPAPSAEAAPRPEVIQAQALQALLTPAAESVAQVFRGRLLPLRLNDLVFAGGFVPASILPSLEEIAGVRLVFAAGAEAPAPSILGGLVGPGEYRFRMGPEFVEAWRREGVDKVISSPADVGRAVIGGSQLTQFLEDPETIYISLKGLYGIGEQIRKEPLVVFVGDKKSLVSEITAKLRNRLNELFPLERAAEVEKILKSLEAGELIEFVASENVANYVAVNAPVYGIAFLRTEADAELAVEGAVDFVLKAKISAKDRPLALSSLVLGMPKAAKSAQGLKGEALRETQRQLDSIFPGAQFRFNGRGFDFVALGEYLTNLLQTHRAVAKAA